MNISDIERTLQGVRYNSDLQIGVRERLRVLGSEHAHFEKLRPPKRAQYGELVLIVVLVLQSEVRCYILRYVINSVLRAF